MTLSEKIHTFCFLRLWRAQEKLIKNQVFKYLHNDQKTLSSRKNLKKYILLNKDILRSYNLFTHKFQRHTTDKLVVMYF